VWGERYSVFLIAPSICSVSGSDSCDQGALSIPKARAARIPGGSSEIIAATGRATLPVYALYRLRSQSTKRSQLPLLPGKHAGGQTGIGGSALTETVVIIKRASKARSRNVFMHPFLTLRSRVRQRIFNFSNSKGRPAPRRIFRDSAATFSDHPPNKKSRPASQAASPIPSRADAPSVAEAADFLSGLVLLGNWYRLLAAVARIALSSHL